jgi:heme exporter protein D
MNWGSVGEFFAMGGYGLYVWGSYAVTFVLIAVELMLVAERHRRARRERKERAATAPPNR